MSDGYDSPVTYEVISVYSHRLRSNYIGTIRPIHNQSPTNKCCSGESAA